MSAHQFGEAARSDSQRILVVEDNAVTRSIVSRTLEMSGRHVVACGTAREASMALRTDRFDVVLADLNLPDSSGLDVLARVRALLPRASRLLMTADPEGGQAAVVDHGDVICQLLFKPVGRERLPALLDDLHDATDGQGRYPDGS